MASIGLVPEASAAGGRTPVQVVVRLKPVTAVSSDVFSASSHTSSIEVKNRRRADSVPGAPDAKSGSYASRGGEAGDAGSQEFFKFVFNGVLQGASSQESTFDTCVKDMADAALSGISCAVLAYGMTGAGKTYTMVGPAGNYTARGMIPRAVEYVCAVAEAARRDTGMERFALRVSYLEIYQDKLMDLLTGKDEAASDASAPQPAFSLDTRSAATILSRRPMDAASCLSVSEDARGRVVVRGLSCPPVRTEAEAMNWLFAGEANRAIAEHALNKRSTRSHCVFTIYIDQQMLVDASTGKLVPPTNPDPASEAAEGSAAPAPQRLVTVTSKLHLVDLAGSERVEKSESEGLLRREAQAINKSLSFLEQVVLALTDKAREHVPYRSSKLTHLLKDSFTVGKTRLIAAVWPDPAHMDETLSTLRFASRMMHVRTTPQRDVVGGGGMSQAERAAIVAAYEAELALLRTELALHDALAGRDGVTYAPLSSAELAFVHESMRAYQQDGAATPPLFPTVRHFQAALAFQRDALAAARTSMALTPVEPPTRARTNDAAVQPSVPKLVTAAASLQPVGSAARAAASAGLASPTTATGSVSTRSAAAGAGVHNTPTAAGPLVPALPPRALAQASGSPASPGIAQPAGVTTPVGTPMGVSRPNVHDAAAQNAELIAWRSEKGPGGKLYADFLLGKQTLAEKKTQLAAKSGELEALRGRMSLLVQQLQAAREGDTTVVDQLQAAKASHKLGQHEVSDLQAEVEYLTRMRASLADRIAQDFKKHWLALCGEAPPA